MRALVLEGGGMRSAFTSGVLDAWMDYDVRYDYVIGTSAGATEGISYVARQKGRSRFSNTDLLRINDYIGLRPMLFGGGAIDIHYLFDVYPDKYYPFDFETYRRTPERCIVVATNALTGEAVYLEEKNNFPRFLEACRASCSLPIVCPMGMVDGMPMVDGGVSDSVPFQKAIDDGADQIDIVLTKPRGYRKKGRGINLPWFIYRKYPNLRRALAMRNELYNAQMERLEQLEDEGRVSVLRPQSDFGVGRMTKDVDKLEQLYDHGYSLGVNFL